MTLTRRKDWEQRLADFVAQRMRTPFEWGKHDCVLFACGAIDAMCDRWVLPIEGRWTSARQAYRACAAFGGLAQAARSVGLPEIPAAFAGRGDLVMVRAPGRASSMRGALGICIADRIAAPGHRGLVMVPLKEGVAAWRV